MFHAKEMRLAVGGAHMDAIRFGRGGKALILIQGLNTRGIRGMALPLAWMYRCFAKEYTVYLFDRRDPVPQGYTVREMAGDIAAAMEQLSIGCADIVGVSQGGMIAQYLAIDRPELVSRLVLCVTLARTNETVKTAVERWIDMVRRGKMREFTADMLERMYSASYCRRYRAMLPLLAALQKPKEPARFAVLAEACLTCGTYEELEKIRCPVLVIGTRQDRVVTGAASEELAQKLCCELYMYEALGHAAYEEAKDFNARILEFLMR